MIRFILLAMGFATLPAWASPWQFDQPIAVTTTHGKNIFHHLEGSGRKNIAVSGKWVAVVWEDNRDGASRCYVAFKAMGAQSFSKEKRISGKGECFEPVVTDAGSGRFLAGAEDDGRVRIRLVSANSIQPSIMLGGEESGQLALASLNDGKEIVAAWSQKSGDFSGIKFARLNVERNAIKAWEIIPVDSSPVAADQQYPSIAFTGEGVTVAWEDRRLKHTIIMASHASNDLHFSPSVRINESARGQAMMQTGMGTGSARVALAAAGKNRIFAVWSDKRDFLSGYDVYGAWSNDGGKTFGGNQKVQDSFGDSIPQWHPAVAANYSGSMAVVWDDDRDGTPDLWLSWPTESGWADNVSIPGASGPGFQSDPAIAMDDGGNLHVVWIAKDDPNGETRLYYALGHHVNDNK